MSPQRKSRFGIALMIVGSLLAATGEVVNVQNMDVLSSSWYLSLELIIIGTFILLIGLLPFAALSEQINGLGFFGCMLLLFGGLLLIIGTTTLDWIILPFLTNLGNAIASAVNGPATETQNALNKIISGLNGLGGSVFQKLFPNAIPHISTVHIPKVNGNTLINNALVQLQLPTIDRLAWWGHFSLSGGTLIIGSLILGVALLRQRGPVALPGALFILFALLNLLCQFVTTVPSFLGNITTVMLFLTLAWLGVAAWIAKRPDATIVEVVEREIDFPDDETLVR